MVDDPFRLNRLPQHKAPDDLWPAIAQRLDSAVHQPARGRSWAALAAGVMLAIALTAIGLRVADDPVAMREAGTGTPPAASAASNPLQRWQRLSAELEQRLAAQRGGIVRAGDLAGLSYIEAELRLTDELLAERPDNPALWQQRAELLGEMTNRYQAGNWQRHLRLASY